MFGGHVFGGSAFSDERRGSSTLNIFFGFGVRIDLEYRIYVATEEFITDASDTPPSQPYSGVLDEAMDFTWSMPSTGGFGGFITGRGSTVISNMDARYDVLTQRYSTDGQPVEIRLGALGTPQTSWPIVFRGLSSGEFIDDASFEISTEDNGYKFDVPVQSRVYGGTGGLDGNSDLSGKPRPLAFGWCANVTPAMVIPGELLFQVHDGRVQAISAVYDRAAPLVFDQDYGSVADLRAATVPPSKYATCLAEGYFRVAFLDAQSGAVTADVQGDVTSAVFAQTTVGIVRVLITRSTALKYPDDVYVPSLTVLDQKQPAPIGVFVGHDDTSTVADVIGKLMVGIGAFAGFRREGKFYVGRVEAPLGPPIKRFDMYNFDPNPQKQKLPDGVWPPPSRWRIGYGKNWTVQTEIAGVVDDVRRSWLAAEYRYATAEAPAIKVDHPFGKAPDPVPGFFRDKEPADEEALRRLALYRASRGLYNFGVTDRDAALLNVGDQNFIRHTRGDLTLGRYMIITQIQHKASDNSAVIQAFG